MKNIYNNYIDYNKYLNTKRCKFDLLTWLKVKKHNSIYIKNKLKNDYYFNDKKLSLEQKEAIFSNEINTLVLSGAGSGKTFTICAKINYLIEHEHIKENEILCISFTNDSVNDLKEKIPYDIDIFTFHKLSTEILKDYNKSINIQSDYLSYIINEIFLSIVNNIDINILKYFNNTITNFINLFKNNNYDISFLDKLIKKNNSKLLLLIKKIYLIYQEELYSSGLIDFNDMINYAIDLINKKGLKRYYKYIIIDEYQDISFNRYTLIKLIKDSCNSKVFVVGDDYQSIYSFAGSNINMITSFKKYFGYSKVIKIRNVYRNSNELIKVSTDFIKKNKKQINKRFISNKNNNKPIKIIYYDKNIAIKFKKLLEIENRNYLILVRNNYNINSILSDDVSLENDKVIYMDREYDYKTIHKSKGLEADDVIILCLENSKFGFPSNRNDNLTNLLVKKERFRYAEERRLFYVALTRTKNNVYLFVSKNNPSVFIKEIIKKNKKYIEVLDL